MNLRLYERAISDWEKMKELQDEYLSEFLWKEYLPTFYDGNILDQSDNLRQRNRLSIAQFKAMEQPVNCTIRIRQD